MLFLTNVLFKLFSKNYFEIVFTQAHTNSKTPRGDRNMHGLIIWFTKKKKPLITESNAREEKKS